MFQIRSHSQQIDILHQALPTFCLYFQLTDSQILKLIRKNEKARNKLL